MENQSVEVEAWGLDYERYALGKFFEKLIPKYNIKTVAEMPAYGAKSMPSIYSIGLALAGADITLVDGNANYKNQWESIGLADKVKFHPVSDLGNTGLPDQHYDFVWNFAYIPSAEHPERLVREMRRISKKYIALFSVNGRNVGYYVHSALHRINNIPWTHGDKKYNYMKNVVTLLHNEGLHVVKKGYVDCPVWPDSLGFRDMRLHRNNITFDNTQWESPYIGMMRTGNIPIWIKLVHAWESIPMLPYIKTLYSHIFYVVAEIQ